jgi:hypothetical protein
MHGQLSGQYTSASVYADGTLALHHWFTSNQQQNLLPVSQIATNEATIINGMTCMVRLKCLLVKMLLLLCSPLFEVACCTQGTAIE